MITINSPPSCLHPPWPTSSAPIPFSMASKMSKSHQDPKQTVEVKKRLGIQTISSFSFQSISGQANSEVCENSRLERGPGQFRDIFQIKQTQPQGQSYTAGCEGRCILRPGRAQGPDHHTMSLLVGPRAQRGRQ